MRLYKITKLARLLTATWAVSFVGDGDNCLADPGAPIASIDTGSVTLSVGGKNLPVEYTLRALPGKKFDPSQPTVVYVPGGPAPITLSAPRNIPRIFPPDVQVIVVEYAGVAHSNGGLPPLTKEEILANLNSSGQAKVIRDVVKKESLEKYVVWGESLGVQQSMRAIDAIQRDPSIKNKPAAAVLDSGTGRQITRADLQERAKKCSGASHREPPPHQVRSCQAPPGLSTGTIKSYVQSCYSKTPTDEQVSQLTTALEPFRFPEDAGVIKKFVGCPPIEEIDYGTWQFSMACGQFVVEQTGGVLGYCSNKCDFPVCGDAKVACEKECSALPQCEDSPLDAKKLKMGGTSILGIQAEDDCQGFMSTMNYLMANLTRDPSRPGLPKPDSYYVSVPAGGHVAYEPRAGTRDFWQGCHGNPAPIFSALFAGQVTEAGKTMKGCYQGAATEPDGDAPPEAAAQSAQ